MWIGDYFDIAYQMLHLAQICNCRSIKESEPKHNHDLYSTGLCHEYVGLKKGMHLFLQGVHVLYVVRQNPGVLPPRSPHLQVHDAGPRRLACWCPLQGQQPVGISILALLHRLHVFLPDLLGGLVRLARLDHVPMHLDGVVPRHTTRGRGLLAPLLALLAGASENAANEAG